MGGGVGRNVSLVHRITPTEEHRVRHPGSIVMAARRPRILPDVDIRLHDVAGVIHKVSEHSRDVVLVLPHDRVMAGRGRKPGFTGGNRRFADELVALVEIGALLGQAHYDLRRAGNTLSVPVTHGWRSRDGAGGRLSVHFRAAGHQRNCRQGQESAEKQPAVHVDAERNASPSLFNTKHLAGANRSCRSGRSESGGERCGYSCETRLFLIASPPKEPCPCLIA